MRQFLLLSLCFIVLACDSASNNDSTETVISEPTAKAVSKYPEHVGDIAFDATLDDASFETCQSRIPQYYALGADYRIDNDVLVSHFESVSSDKNTALTYHTIRFIVNCKGKIGRIREETMDGDYQSSQLEPVMQQGLMDKLLAFDQWPEGRDFYQYLTFKIEGGKIKEVLP